MNFNPAAVLALISSLYEQLAAAQERIAALEAQHTQRERSEE